MHGENDPRERVSRQVGDFLQLPPVADRGQAVKFCFESPLWNTLVDHHCELKVVHRCFATSFCPLMYKLMLGVKCVHVRVRNTTPLAGKRTPTLSKS